MSILTKDYLKLLITIPKGREKKLGIMPLVFKPQQLVSKYL